LLRRTGNALILGLVQGLKTPDSLGQEHCRRRSASQDYRLSFAEALPRTAETRLIFRLAAKPGAF
jgi:hypothetical protein